MCYLSLLGASAPAPLSNTLLYHILLPKYHIHILLPFPHFHFTSTLPPPQAVKEFPFPESQLFKMLVTNFSMCKDYGTGQSAAEYINGAFNGQKGFKVNLYLSG